MDIFIEFIKQQYHLIGFIIYILYNEYKRWRIDSTDAMAERIELIQFKARSESDQICQNSVAALTETERYVFSQFKKYKTSFLEKVNYTELVVMAIDDILLTALTKNKRSLMIHIKGNGYHNLSNSELEDYIEYLTDEFIDTLMGAAEKAKNTVDIIEYIDRNEVINMIRKIIDTTLGIQKRLVG